MRGPAEALWVRCGKLLSLILTSFILLACQSPSVKPAGRTVPEGKWVLLSQYEGQSGRWESNDLTLDYKYDRDQSQLGISGVIHFTGPIRGEYEIVNYFHLDIIPVDVQGTVLDMIGLTSEAEINLLYDGPINFYKTLSLPANTAGMAFSYTGRASGGGTYFDGGFTDFWEYPYY